MQPPQFGRLRRAQSARSCRRATAACVPAAHACRRFPPCRCRLAGAPLGTAGSSCARGLLRYARLVQAGSRGVRCTGPARSQRHCSAVGLRRSACTAEPRAEIQDVQHCKPHGAKSPPMIRSGRHCVPSPPRDWKNWSACDAHVLVQRACSRPSRSFSSGATLTQSRNRGRIAACHYLRVRNRGTFPATHHHRAILLRHADARGFPAAHQVRPPCIRSW